MKLGFFSSQNLHRLEVSLRGASFSIKFLYTLFIAAFVLGFFTYLSFINHSGSDLVLTLIISTIITLILLVLMIATRLVKIFIRRKQGAAGARFHSRLVIVFSLLAITPTVLIYFMSSALFERGVQALVGNFTQHVVTQTTTFSDTLKASLNHSMQKTAYLVSKDILEKNHSLSRSKKLLKTLRELKSNYNLENIFIIKNTNVISASNHEIFHDNISPRESLVWGKLFKNLFVVYFSKDQNLIIAGYPLDLSQNYFLFISKEIESYLPKHFQSTQKIAQKYSDIQQNRWHIRFMFMLIYGLFALLSLLIAIGISLMLADHIARPIGQLVSAAQRIRKGELDTRVQIEPNVVEFLGLAKAFNLMVNELQEQRDQLETANAEINRRKNFIEITLKGLTSGVVGVDENNHVKVINDSALKILKVPPLPQEFHFIDIFPEASELLYEQSNLPLTDEKISQFAQKLLLVERNDSLYYLSIHIANTNQHSHIRKVITIDDITDLHLAQKKAAWGDVARRVAHEIKNPLTPIQLSAEQLKRKITKLLDNPTSKQLVVNIETIIQKVDEIKNIVQEFSQLSRMPQSILNEHDILKVLANNILLQRIAYEEINFVENFSETSATVLCDPQLLSQALQNILKNAIESILETNEKNTKKQILIKLTKTDKNVTIKVSDSGRGFPKNMIEQCLEPYVTTKKQGTGLGLAITKKIIDDHNGSLSLKNLSPHGAEVIIKLPLYKIESLQ